MLSSAHSVCAAIHEAILSIIAPPVCAHCKKSLTHEEVLCTTCVTQVKKIATYELVITKHYAVKVFAAGAYQEILQELILAKKHRKMYAARLLGVLIWEHSDLPAQRFDYIVPVPLHWRRYAERGYNQAYEIACALSKKSGKPVLNCLHKMQATKAQATLPAAERGKNVEDVFVVAEKYAARVRGAKILIVDDVLTTGSTMRECVRALRMKRPSLIIAAVAARVV